jgi:hypothetical protein
MRSQIDMAGNVKQRLHWIVHFPREPDSDLDRWLKCAENMQSERDLIRIVSPQPEKPQVVRRVRGFVAWKDSESAQMQGSLPAVAVQ